MRYKSLFLSLTAAGIALSSCTKDAAYDALTETDGIDLTITVANGGLTIPFGSTDVILLTELIDPEESDVIDLDKNGNYKISKDDDFDPTTFDVKKTSVNSAPEIEADKFLFEIPDENITDARLLRYIKEDAPEWMTLEEVIEKTIDYEIELEYNKQKTETRNKLYNDNYAAMVTSGIMTESEYAAYIDELVETEAPSLEKVTADVKADIVRPTEFTSHCDDLTFDSNSDFNLEANDVDEGLKSVLRIDFEKASNNVNITIDLIGLPVTENNYDINISDLNVSLPDYFMLSDDGYDKVLTDAHTLNLTRKIPVASGTAKAKTEANFDLMALQFATPLVNEGGKLCKSDGKITVTGSASTTPMTITSNKIVVRKNENGESILALKDSIEVVPTISKIETEVVNVYGYFDPEVDPVNTNVEIDLGDDMDFLKDEDAKIDIKNPWFTIDINNNCPLPLFASITLVGDNGKQITFNDVNLTPDPDTDKLSIVLCAAEEITRNMYTDPALCTFLQPVPDNIDVKLEVKADSQNPYDFELGKEYSISGHYYVTAPLEFNNIKIKYDEVVETEFDEDMTDKLNEINNAVLHLKVESTLEIDLDLTIVAQDEDGNELPGLISMDPVIIKANATTEVNSAISIKGLDRIANLDVRIIGSGSDCKLVSTQYIRILESSLKLNSLKLDLNDK